jgi:hypothetical protein
LAARSPPFFRCLRYTSTRPGHDATAQGAGGGAGCQLPESCQELWREGAPTATALAKMGGPIRIRTLLTVHTRCSWCARGPQTAPHQLHPGDHQRPTASSAHGMPSSGHILAVRLSSFNLNSGLSNRRSSRLMPSCTQRKRSGAP